MVEIVGIDLGTTKSVVAVWRDNAPQVIPDAEGRMLTPSLVAVNQDNGQWQIGHTAREENRDHPDIIIHSIKRFMGRRFDESVVQETLRKLPMSYHVNMTKQGGGIEVAIGNNAMTPPEVAAKILQQVKANAERSLGHEISQAVITVPAYFHHTQRQATHDAAHLAGLEVTRLLNEPTAACLAFGYDRMHEMRKRIAVYDLGGGTFDISIMEVGRGPFRVLSINGNTFLGGNDLNTHIVDYLLAQVDSSQQHYLRHNSLALARLYAFAEQAKIDLSEKDESTIRCPDLLPSQGEEMREVRFTLTRAKLEEIARPWIEQTLEPCVQALYDAKLQPSAIDDVLLVGGQTRMPAIQHAVRDFFGKEPNCSVNPEEVVALGAAVMGAMQAKLTPDLRLADVVPLSLGVNTREKMSVLIPRNTPLPYEKTATYTTFYDHQDSVEVVVYQGEGLMVEQNVKLGSFILPGIIPAPHHIPEIAIKFEVDIDGILHVMAQDRQTNVEKNMTITDSVNMTQEQIAERIRDAEEHAAMYAAQHRQSEMHDQAELIEEKLKNHLAQMQESLSPDMITATQIALQHLPNESVATRLERLQQIWKEVSHRSHSVPEMD